MGMTIDEAIVWLNTDDFESKGFADATSVAIDTMRKYQKISEIVKAWNDMNSFDSMVQIREVLEDDCDDGESEET
jgi:hypothetical protein